MIAAKEVTSVSDMFTQGIAMDAQRELAGLAKLLETSRTAIKAPVLELGRTIDAKAKMLMTGLNEEQIRINKLVTAYQDEERRKAQAAERARLAEIARIEAEQRKSAEAERKAQAEAEDAFTRTDREAAEKALAELRQGRCPNCGQGCNHVQDPSLDEPKRYQEEPCCEKDDCGYYGKPRVQEEPL